MAVCPEHLNKALKSLNCDCLVRETSAKVLKIVVAAIGRAHRDLTALERGKYFVYGTGCANEVDSRS